MEAAQKLAIDVSIPYDKTIVCYGSQVFADCTLACKGQKFSAHRIILSKFSPKLREYFKQNQTYNGSQISTQNPIVLNIDCQSAKYLQTLLNLIYSFHASFALFDMPYILKLAYDFNFSVISPLLTSSLLASISNSSICQILSSFKNISADVCSFPLISMAAALIRDITITSTSNTGLSNDMKREFVRANGVPSVKREEILSVIPSSQFFIRVLKSPLLFEFTIEKHDYKSQIESKTIFDDKKQRREFLLSLIEEFFKGKEVGQESEELEKMVGFVDEDYTDLIHHSLEWISDKTSRILITKALRNRRSAFQSLSGINFESTSIWAPFQWISNMQDSEKVEDKSVKPIQLFKWMSTLGDYCQRFDCSKYGFIQLEAVGAELSQANSVKSILGLKDGYFCAFRTESQAPGLKILFGKAKLSFCKIVVEFNTRRNIKYHPSAEVRAFPIKSLKLACDGVDCGQFDIANGDIATFDSEQHFGKKWSQPAREILLQAGSADRIIRIREVSVFGVFCP